MPKPPPEKNATQQAGKKPKGIPRRPLLLALLGTATTTALAITAWKTVGNDAYQSYRKDCGPKAPIPPTSHSTILAKKFSSTIQGTTIPCMISLPPGVTPSPTLPVLYVLHGLGSSAGHLFEGKRLHDTLAQAITQEGATPFAIAAMDGGSDFWHARAGRGDTGKTFRQEFVPFVENELGIGSAARRGILGFSMGGYGALLAAETEPALFHAVAAISPAIWTTYKRAKKMNPKAFDNRADFDTHNVMTMAGKLAEMPVRLHCGKSDNWCRDTSDLIASLPTTPEGGFDTGCHDNDFWLRVAPGVMEFFSRHLTPPPPAPARTSHDSPKKQP